MLYFHPIIMLLRFYHVSGEYFLLLPTMGVIVYMLLKFRERYNGTFTRELVTDTYKKSTQMKGNVGYLKVVVLKGWLVGLIFLPTCAILPIGCSSDPSY
jgi:hypothetical protein